MFDIGWSEMAIIVIVTLVVLGPKGIAARPEDVFPLDARRAQTGCRVSERRQ